MKNLFLSTAFALLSVASFAQELTRSLTEPITAAFMADSISIFELSGGCLELNPNLRGVINYSQFDFTHVATYGAHDAIHTWKKAGAYGVVCTVDGEVEKMGTVFIINDDYVDFVVKHSNALVIDENVYSNMSQYVGFEEFSIVAVD